MSVLAYSKLLEKITGIDEKDLEKPFIILSRLKTTPNRLKLLKNLANLEKSSIGGLLKNSNMNRSGGSYLTLKKYFLELEKEGILIRNKVGFKEEWSFSKENLILKDFIRK